MCRLMSEDKKVIFITALHPQISKNILSTKAFSLLTESEHIQIVLIVPETKKHFFERHYVHPRVIIEGIEMQRFVESQPENILNTISRLLIDTHYLHYKRHELLDARKSICAYIQYFVRESLVFLFADRRLPQTFFRFVDKRLSRKKIFSSLFATYRPDAVFTTDLFEQLGLQMIREAHALGIETIGMVRSWDNCLSKGLLRFIPDKIIVNNEVLKEEAISIHGVHKDAVSVVGLPQFDAFINGVPTDRETFFRENGLDPQKRLVVFAPAGTILSDTDADICDMLISLREEGRLPRDVQFFVRNHPQHPANLKRFDHVPDLFVQMPGEILDPKTHKETELAPHEQVFLRDLMAYTDALVWVATSLCLDALVFDVPQVVVNFDGYKTKNYYQSVKRYHNEDHMKKMFLSDPFRVVRNKDELCTGIIECLDTPELRSKGRRRIRELQLEPLDGRAGERIAHVVGGV